MLVTLLKLKPNPFRLFKVDPIDQEAVAALTQSIKEDGFWGGVVCRVNEDGDVEVAAGHHRVAAAINAGMKQAEVFIAELDDESMIRVYARENATQRGNTSTAGAGSVAAAIQFLAKAQFLFTPTSGSEKKGGAARDGIGEPAITEFLKDVFGDGTKSMVTGQLANLKKSGDYAEILRDVQEEVDKILRLDQERVAKEVQQEEKRRKEAEEVSKREAVAAQKAADEAKRRSEEAKRLAVAAQDAKRAADRSAAEAAAKRAEADRLAAERVALESAKRAAAEAKIREERKAELDAEAAAITGKRKKAMDAVDKAEQQEVLFDFAGVAQYLKNEKQVNAFRDIATSVGVQPYLPVKNQAQIAKQIVDLAKSEGRELSAAFIREVFIRELHGVKKYEGNAKRDAAKSELEKMDREAKLAKYQREFSRNVHGVAASGKEIAEILRKFPKGEPMKITGEFKESLKSLRWTVTMLEKHNLI